MAWSPTCSRCGSPSGDLRWHTSFLGCLAGMVAPVALFGHLHACCRNCGFHWQTKNEKEKSR
jgi:hypothetical protein